MAFLKRLADGDQYSLTSSHLVGRSPGSNLQLGSQLVSSTHAEIRWNGSTWELRDLGSRNGTFVGARRLESGERVTIQRGARIAFGDIEALFELVDDGPPCAAAISQDGQRQEAEDGYLVLPGPEQPVLTVFDEGGGNWIAEANSGIRQRVSSGEEIRIASQSWRLDLPMISESTWQPDSTRFVLHRMTMRFNVSRDEEHVKVSLIQDDRVMPLASRTHHYVLLALARARLEDREQGDLSEAEEGWCHVEDLVDMLRIAEPTLNVSIWRARRALAQVGVLGAAEIVERRPNPPRVRLGVQNIEVTVI